MIEFLFSLLHLFVDRTSLSVSQPHSFEHYTRTKPWTDSAPGRPSATAAQHAGTKSTLRPVDNNRSGIFVHPRHRHQFIATPRPHLPQHSPLDTTAPPLTPHNGLRRRASHSSPPTPSWTEERSQSRRSSSVAHEDDLPHPTFAQTLIFARVPPPSPPQTQRRRPFVPNVSPQSPEASGVAPHSADADGHIDDREYDLRLQRTMCRHCGCEGHVSRDCPENSPDFRYHRGDKW